MEHVESLKLSWTYDMAALVRGQIFDKENFDNHLNSIQCFIDSSEPVDILEKGIKPYKRTMLHDFIDCSIHLEIEYILGKIGFVSLWKRLLLDYGITSIGNYQTQELEENADFFEIEEELESALLNTIKPKVTNEVFTLLFSDRELLLEFNKYISSLISTLKKVDYPKYLKSDGKLIRFSKWPRWVVDAVFNRDKGHCSSCFTDLTGVYVTGKEVQIDHIVPINLGGTNDITNLQVLCRKCNSDKGGNNISTSDKYFTYW